MTNKQHKLNHNKNYDHLSKKTTRTNEKAAASKKISWKDSDYEYVLETHLFDEEETSDCQFDGAKSSFCQEITPYKSFSNSLS